MFYKGENGVFTLIFCLYFVCYNRLFTFDKLFILDLIVYED